MDAETTDRFARKMQDAGMPPIATQGFLRALRFVSEGGQTMIPESAIEPATDVERLDAFEGYAGAGLAAMARSVVIKLNGGLGTSMGLSQAKSLLEVRPGLSFLDLIAKQVLAQRARWDSPIPFLLMNSYRTQADSLERLARYPELETEGPLDFLQNKVPRVDAETFEPVEYPDDPALEWCPPGHGDLYGALVSSGTLERLLAQGIRYAFVSNADNLGAVLDPRILGFMAENEVPFVMEVAERTHADRKGGHLARRDGQLVLREVAQCPAEDRAAFEDVARHRFFNTNNLWLDLEALAAVFERSPAGLPLPVIRNDKRVSPTDSTSPRCLQLETAMGSAIECFAGARAIVVPRDRFAPVKTTNDLLAVWSDAFELTDDARLVARDPEQFADCVIDLDPRFYGHVDALAEHFAEGPPSLVKCRRFAVSGEFRFGRGVSIQGEAHLLNEDAEPVEIESGEVLGSDL